jgi:hypothetical protein
VLAYLTEPVTTVRRLAAFALLLSAVVLPLNEWVVWPLPAQPSSPENWDKRLPSLAAVTSVTIDPEHPDTLYSGTYSLLGLWHSADCDETWKREGQAEAKRPYSHLVSTILWDTGCQCW